MTYAAGHAKEAQELEMLEADKKRAIMVEGPNSARVREDTARIQSLRTTLEKAGLMKQETKLESIDNHIAALRERATGEGLVVQPVNGQ